MDYYSTNIENFSLEYISERIALSNCQTWEIWKYWTIHTTDMEAIYNYLEIN